VRAAAGKEVERMGRDLQDDFQALARAVAAAGKIDN
jgi:hypothetical protein